MRIYPSDDGNAAFVSLRPDEELLEGLGQAVDELGIQAATVQLIGGLRRATLGYFDPEQKEYVKITTGHVEISAGIGNVSLKDGRPFLHLHLTLSDRDGHTVGGHAMQGCTAYVVEAYFRKLGGPAPVRQDAPGLSVKVWPGD